MKKLLTALMISTVLSSASVSAQGKLDTMIEDRAQPGDSSVNRNEMCPVLDERTSCGPLL